MNLGDSPGARRALPNLPDGREGAVGARRPGDVRRLVEQPEGAVVVLLLERELRERDQTHRDAGREGDLASQPHRLFEVGAGLRRHRLEEGDESEMTLDAGEYEPIAGDLREFARALEGDTCLREVPVQGLLERPYPEERLSLAGRVAGRMKEIRRATKEGERGSTVRVPGRIAARPRAQVAFVQEPAPGEGYLGLDVVQQPLGLRPGMLVPCVALDLQQGGDRAKAVFDRGKGRSAGRVRRVHRSGEPGAPFVPCAARDEIPPVARRGESAGAGAFVKVTFLGTGAGNFRGDRRHMCSAFVDGLLLDCGAGTTGRLYDAGLFEKVEGVLISHLHSDHIAGLFDFLLHTLIVERTRPLTIVSPPGLSPILRAMNAAGAMVRDVAEVYPLRLIEATEPESAIGRWTIRGVPLHHTVYNVGYEVRANGTVLYYTGDTMQPSAPEGLRADVVIHEATYAQQDAGRAIEFGHSTAAEAARAAERLGAKRLFLTHIGGRDGTEAAVARESRAIFPDTVVAEDAQQYDL